MLSHVPVHKVAADTFAKASWSCESVTSGEVTFDWFTAATSCDTPNISARYLSYHPYQFPFLSRKRTYSQSGIRKVCAAIRWERVVITRLIPRLLRFLKRSRPLQRGHTRDSERREMDRVSRPRTQSTVRSPVIPKPTSRFPGCHPSHSVISASLKLGTLSTAFVPESTITICCREDNVQPKYCVNMLIGQRWMQS